jgi:hypothetical protein
VYEKEGKNKTKSNKNKNNVSGEIGMPRARGKREWERQK